MEGYAREICLKSFDFKGQAVYNGVKTHAQPDGGRVQQEFSHRELNTPSPTVEISTTKMSTFSRSVVVIGKAIEKRLFPHESPIGKTIKTQWAYLHDHRRRWVKKARRSAQSQDDICVIPITRFFENFGESNRTVNIATQSFSQETYNRHARSGRSAPCASPVDFAPNRKTISKFTRTIHSRARLLPLPVWSGSGRSSSV